MNHSVQMPANEAGLRRPVFTGALVLAAGLVVAIAVARLSMAIPFTDLLLLAAYLLATGVASLVLGWVALTRAEKRFRLTLRRRIFLVSLAGSLSALASVFIVSQLMFVSTAHDLRVLAATLGFNVFVMGAFGAFVASSVSRRVELVADFVNSLAAGNYQQRIDAAGSDELARLALTVNNLARQLEVAERAQAQLEAERRDLTAAVSHDLRTPLASIRAMVEALADGIISDGVEAQRYYAVMQREIDRLGRMVEDLFDLSQIDSGVFALNRQLLPLDEIAADVVEAMGAQARSLSVDLTLECEAGLPRALIDGHRIERVIANLLRNALEHTPSQGRVEVALRRDREYVVLSVADTGHGIDAEQLPRIWQRFYRAEVSRVRSSGGGGDGAGLGLAIVRGFVEAHGGSVSAESSLQSGSVFSFKLPATAA